MNRRDAEELRPLAGGEPVDAGRALEAIHASARRRGWAIDRDDLVALAAMPSKYPVRDVLEALECWVRSGSPARAVVARLRRLGLRVRVPGESVNRKRPGAGPGAAALMRELQRPFRDGGP